MHDTSGGNCLHEIVGERLRAPTCSAMGGRHFLDFVMVTAMEGRGGIFGS